MGSIARNIVGKRLTYKQLIAGKSLCGASIAAAIPAARRSRHVCARLTSLEGRRMGTARQTFEFLAKQSRLEGGCLARRT